MVRTRHRLELSEDEEDFESPEATANETSYRLSYTRLGAMNLDGPSTSRAAAAAAAAAAPSSRTKNYARKSTSRGPQVITSPVTRGQAQMKNTSKPEGSARRKKTKPHNRHRQELQFLREVRRLQNTTDLLIPKLPFGRLVREIMYATGTEVNRMSFDALAALQEATELYITQTLNDAFLLAQHTKRRTLFVSDIQMLRVLKLIT